MNTTILPPRFEAPAVELNALPEIPVYEEVSGSLRPTWLPVDPATYTIAPQTRAPKRSRAGLVAGFAVAAVAVWAGGFAAVVGGHAYLEHRSKVAAAAQPESLAPDPTPRPAASSVDTTAAPTASSVTLTVNVNDLPIAREAKPRGRKSHARGS